MCVRHLQVLKMGFYSLPTGKLHKKRKTRKLNNLPMNFEGYFYKNKLDNIDGTFDSNFQRKMISSVRNSNDVKNYLLPSSKLGQHMQEDINMYITRNRLNEGSFIRKLDPIFKNIIH